MRKLTFIFFFILNQGLIAQTNNLKPFQIAFYNLENLFDTLHDPYTEDYEYLPTSQKNGTLRSMTTK